MAGVYCSTCSSSCSKHLDPQHGIHPLSLLLDGASTPPTHVEGVATMWPLRRCLLYSKSIATLNFLWRESWLCMTHVVPVRSVSGLQPLSSIAVSRHSVSHHELALTVMVQVGCWCVSLEIIRLVGLKSLCCLLGSLLSERSIVIICEDLSVLSRLVLLLLSAISPLKWEGAQHLIFNMI